MLFSLPKHYFDLYMNDTALKVSQSLYCFTTSICHGVENYFPKLWGTGISDAFLFTSAPIYVRDFFNSLFKYGYFSLVNHTKQWIINK